MAPRTRYLYNAVKNYRNSSDAVEEYFLDQQVPGDELIVFCGSVLNQPKHPLLKFVVRMFVEIPETAALSASLSSGWKYDAIKACREQHILPKLIQLLNSPSTQMKKHCLNAISVFLVNAIDQEKISNGFPTFFALGKQEIMLVSGRDLKNMIAINRKSRSASVRQAALRISTVLSSLKV